MERDDERGFVVVGEGQVLYPGPPALACGYWPAPGRVVPDLADGGGRRRGS